MPDAYDVSNIVKFIGGFGQKRGEIAAANQADKEYKLQTIQTLFQFAEGKRASAEASQALAGDVNLSENERQRHALAAEQHTKEGESIYAGASELFGMIDEKPKTGKKENPAMQFLKFVNPFTRRGPQPGQFEQELSDLLAGLGGAKGGEGTDLAGLVGGGGTAGGAESPGFAAGGAARQAPTGQGAGDPGQAAVTGALQAAIPGVGPTPRLPAAEGPVSSAASTLAQQQPVGPPFTTSPVAGATGEATQAGVPPVTAITPTPALGPDLSASSRELYPHIIGTRSAYKDMNLVDYNQNINREGQQAVRNLNDYIISTPQRETFEDAMNDPEFIKHYRPASRAYENLEQYDIFQSNVADIFPEMRTNPPEAGATLAARVADQFRLEQRAGKFGDASTWAPATIAAVEAYDVWASMQERLSPEFGVLRRYISITRKDQAFRTPAEQREVNVFIDLYNRGIYGAGTGPGRGGAVNYSFQKGTDPETGLEVYFAFDPRNPGSGGDILRDASGRKITTEGPLDLEEIMYTAEWQLNPETGAMQRKSWKVEEKKVVAALSRPGTRRQIEAWMGSGLVFDTITADRIQKYLDDNPTAGLAPGEDVTPGPGNPGNVNRPQLGGAGLEAFRARAKAREDAAKPPPAYVPPPSPYE